MLLYTYKVKRKEGEIMFDYFDELIYCADYLDYQDPEYIEKINSDDQYYEEVVAKNKKNKKIIELEFDEQNKKSNQIIGY